MAAKAKSWDATSVIGLTGCGGLLVGLPVVFFLGLITDWRALLVLVGFIVMIVVAFKVDNKAEQTRSAERRKRINDRLQPGVRFKAHGSAGSKMEGRVIRRIDDDTIEAYVGYADGHGGKEQGPFPISNIDSVGDDDDD